MADDELVKILKQGVEAWNKWRRENPEIWLDLAGADLIDASLSGANLSRANLSFALLNGANFRAADRYRAEFFSCSRAAFSTVPPFLRYSVMPVARNV
jgi:hypothetical protein